MKKPKEETVPLSKYQHEVDSIRMSWSGDVQKMMKLWDSHQRLIGVIEGILKNPREALLESNKIVTEINRAKGVKI